MDAVLLPTSELAFGAMLARSGVELVQYRNKQVSCRRLFEIAQELVSLFRATPLRLVVNDRADVAVVAGAGGVHVGQEDLGVEEARAICGPGRWVGVSTHMPEQVRTAEQTSADYIAVGPIFPTSTKENPGAVVGLDFIRQARQLTRKPLVAIGGITLKRAPEVFQAGADSVAVARDLLRAPDPAVRARQFLEQAAEIYGEAR